MLEFFGFVITIVLVVRVLKRVQELTKEIDGQKILLHQLLGEFRRRDAKKEKPAPIIEEGPAPQGTPPSALDVEGDVVPWQKPVGTFVNPPVGTCEPIEPKLVRPTPEPIAAMPVEPEKPKVPEPVREEPKVAQPYQEYREPVRPLTFDDMPQPTPLEVFMQKALAQARAFLFKEGVLWVMLGSGVLLFGIVFLIHYSISQGWISMERRLMGSAALGLALAGLGIWLRPRRRLYALLLQGCGLSVVYLTTVAAARVEPVLLGSVTALSVLSVLVVVTAGLAVWQNARVVAHVAVTAGFFAPLLVSQGSKDFVGLFAFYLLLNLGILAVTYVKPWRRLCITGFSLTFGLFAMWVIKDYQAVPEIFNRSFAFLCAYYGLYVFMGARSLPPESEGKEGRISTDVTLTLLAPLCFLSLACKMVYTPHLLTALFMSCGALYAMLSWVLRGRGQGFVMLLRAQAIVCLNIGGILLLRDVDPTVLKMRVIVAMVWAVEGAVLYVTGRRLGRVETWGFGVLAWIIAGGLCVWNMAMGFFSAPLYYSPEFLVCLVLAGSLMGAAALSPEERQPKDVLKDFGLPVPLVVCGLWVIGLSLAAEFVIVFNREGFTTAGYWLLIASSALVLISAVACKCVPKLGRLTLSGKEDEPALVSFAMLPAFAAAVLVVRFFAGNLLMLEAGGYGMAGTAGELWSVAIFLAATGLLFVPQVAQLFSQPTCLTHGTFNVWLRRIWTAVAFAFAGNLLGLLSSDMVTFGVLIRAPVVLLALTVMCYPAVLERVPFWRERTAGDVVMPLLAAGTLLQIPSLLVSDGGIQGFYWPLISPVDCMGIVVICMPMLYYYKLKTAEEPGSGSKLAAGLGVLLFVLLNVIVARCVHAFADVWFTLDDMFASGIFQTAAAVTWGVVGIGTMVIAYRLKNRLPWIMGAVLVIADVLKLFLIDLSKTGTLERIVSFVIVGLLLIGVGYFAPLPPRKRTEEDSAEPS